jgi:beta-lactamase class A
MTALLWQQLQHKVQQQIDAFPGVAGVVVRDLHGDQTLALNADEIFPTASAIKIHILVQLLLRAEAGEIDLHELMPVRPAQHVGGSGVLAYLDGAVQLTLLDLANLMIIASDNTATNLCLEIAGIEATNDMLRRLGLNQTHLRRKMMDHLAAVREQENVSTPNELALMMEYLYHGRPTPAVAERCLTILKKPTLGFIDKALPSTLPCANKPGWVEGTMCDVALVYLPRRPYIVTVMSKYALCAAPQQEYFIVRCAQTIHEHMAALDRSNQFGRGVYEV